MKGANNSDVSQSRLRLSRQNGGASKDAMSFHLPPPRLPGLGQTSAYAETDQPLAGKTTSSFNSLRWVEPQLQSGAPAQDSWKSC